MMHFHRVNQMLEMQAGRKEQGRGIDSVEGCRGREHVVSPVAQHCFIEGVEGRVLEGDGCDGVFASYRPTRGMVSAGT